MMASITMNNTTALFYVFSAVLLLASFRVITARSTVHAALFLVLAWPVGARMKSAEDKMLPEKALFKYSIVYLFVLFAALVADRVAAYQGWIV